MITLQNFTQTGRKFIKRGWSPWLRLISRIYPKARLYPAILKNRDIFYLDLFENMCHGYFYYGELPHEKYTDAFLKKYVKSGDTIIDVGANIGYYTRIASALTGKKGRVFAFEPMPSAFNLLIANTKNLINVKSHEIAISDIKGKSRFSIQKYGDTSSLVTNRPAKSVITVQTNTLDNIFQNENKIDLIKIDVEGFEYEVIKGAIKIIQAKSPLLYFEHIDKYTSNRGLTIDDFKALLEPLNYSLGWVNPNFPNSDLITKKESSYVVAVPATNRWNIVV
jgi:FkbM family methyltransferase